MKSVLFIAKKGQEYSYSSYGAPSGLLNSAKFVVDMLLAHGIRAGLVQVVDGNDIDREVFKFKPDVVIIEAIWVTPSKFLELIKLHPRVQWVVRVHSEVPFLAQEGMAIKWLREYQEILGVYVAFNSAQAVNDFSEILAGLYLPNYFPLGKVIETKKYKDVVHVGCFGAIRPLKNQLIQAMAAVRYAEDVKKRLFFHINESRVEGGAEVLKNIRNLFRGTKNVLVEYGWMNHGAFQKILAMMNVSMCVSLSESFCIVGADSVSVGTPLVCSSELPWAASISQAEPTNMDSIVDTMHRVIKYKNYSSFVNRFGLRKYDKQSVTIWLGFLK